MSISARNNEITLVQPHMQTPVREPGVGWRRGSKKDKNRVYLTAGDYRIPTGHSLYKNPFPGSAISVEAISQIINPPSKCSGGIIICAAPCPGTLCPAPCIRRHSITAASPLSAFRSHRRTLRVRLGRAPCTAQRSINERGASVLSVHRRMHGTGHWDRS
jgi:hypothetical protein